MPAPGHNTKVTAWQKRVKIERKVKSKRQGIQKKHTETVKLVSGARTGKAKRKLARKERLDEKTKAALADAVKDVEMQDTSSPSKAGKKQRQQQKKGQQQQQQKQKQKQHGEAAAAPEAMQE